MNDKYKRRAIVGQEMLIKRLETKLADADRKIKTLLAACRAISEARYDEVGDYIYMAGEAVRKAEGE